MTKPRGRPPHNDVLTPAEWRTLHFVRHGLTNQQIADRRGITLEAVKYHVRNIVAKLQVENRRALKTWTGAPRDGALRAQGDTMIQEDRISGIGQIARTVSDIKASEAWYRDVLGLPHLYTFGDLAFFDCGGTRLMLSQVPDGPQDESLFYLRVPDIEKAHARLVSAHVTIVSAPHCVHKHEDGTEEWMAFFHDLEQRPLAIMASVAPALDASVAAPATT